MADWEDDLYRSQAAAAEKARDMAYQTAQSNYDTSAGIVNNTADSAITKQNRQSDSALQQAYIGKQMDMRNIGQQLAALGYSGGASETSLLNLMNAYRKNRSDTEIARGDANNATNLQRQSDLANLLTALNSAKQSAYDTYTTNLANYQSAAYERELQRQAIAAAQAAQEAASYSPAYTPSYTPSNEYVSNKVRETVIENGGIGGPNSSGSLYKAIESAKRSGATQKQISDALERMGIY